MKKITEIKIDNYKAYIEPEIIKLSKGENLFIYGENGSGKSSLFNALKYFLHSSVHKLLPFESNCFSTTSNGEINVTFMDYDSHTNNIIDGSNVSYFVSNDPDNSTNAQPFIKHGFRVCGFLDYSQLLKVYLNKGDRPNLFELVNELLGEYVPTKYGFHETFSEIVQYILNSTRNSCHRTDHAYVNGVNKFVQLQQAYSQIISDLNNEFSMLMSNYFPEFKLEINLAEANIKLDETGRIKDTEIKGNLFINVIHYGTALRAYNNKLNEARLSAIAICLYLATLKLKNQISDIKLLYLDDVFVGLDSANRRPILKMIMTEFSSFQIIISTYDKSWYKLAKEIIGASDVWKFAEMYESEHITSAGQIVSKPLFIYSVSMIDKARKYLYDRERPDYPAAANYMRKSFEELLSTGNYRPSVLNADMEPIEAYKIPKLIQSTQTFLSSIPLSPNASEISNLLSELITYLKPMLHPLSHYAPDEPIYKTELLRADKLYNRLKSQLIASQYSRKCQVIVPKGGQLMLKIGSTGNWSLEILLEMEEHLIIYEDSTGKKHVSESPLHTIYQKLIVQGKEDNVFKLNKKMGLFANLCYKDLNDCISKIDAYLCSPKCNRLNRLILPNIFDMYYLMDNPILNSSITYTTKLSSKL